MEASHIVATMQWVNAGNQPLEVSITLDPNAAAGFAGGKFKQTVESKKSASVQFDLRPPGELKVEVLKGAIRFGDASEPDRDLYIAVQGSDSKEFADRHVEKITARAQVVGTFAPRTPDAIEQLIQDLALRDPSGGPELVIDANYQIEFDEKANPEAAQAVADLKHCAQKIAGLSLAVSPSVAQSPAIRIRRLERVLVDWPHTETYHIYIRGNDVVIESRASDGLRHGVYGLLTDHMDCHWFTPKALGKEFTRSNDGTIRFQRFEETKSPSFFSSPGMSWGSAPQWDRQNRAVINRGRMSFGHAWQGLIDKSQYPYDKFPDMWSRDKSGMVQVFDKDWSATNFCSTNPQVIRIIAEKINAKFDANPDAIAMSLDPNDYAPMCQCERCLALDARYGVKPTDDKQMADRLLHFSKEIYDRLKPAHKQKFLGILAYGFQTRPPKGAVPHPHHATIVCGFPGYADHTRPWNDPTSSFNRDFYEIVKGWGARVKQLGYYDYYGLYNFFGPWGILHKLREDLPAFKELGGTFVVIESQPNFAMHGLNLYVAARLVWDIDADVDIVADEYFSKFYGPAAKPMREFYQTAERYYALTRPGTETAIRVGQNPRFWVELDGYLKQAEEKVRGVGEADKRFADRIAFARDGFTFGSLMAERGAHRKDVAFLESMKREIDRLKAKYLAANEKYPTLTPGYFWPDVDAMLKQAN